MSEKVKVNLVVEKRDRYQKTLLMSREEFEDFNNRLERCGADGRLATEELGELVDGYDWFDGEVEEIEEFNIIEDESEEE